MEGRENERVYFNLRLLYVSDPSHLAQREDALRWQNKLDAALLARQLYQKPSATEENRRRRDERDNSAIRTSVNRFVQGI